MTKELSLLVDRLNDPIFSETDVISWGSPVPSFGNLSSARIATLGLNPSNKEFVDDSGNELNGSRRRFHTLGSLGLSKWSEIQQEHLNSILEYCQDYFNRNPYDAWFKKLDNIISGTSMSYYFPSGQACHLDLIPYATASKWTDLTSEQKSMLLDLSGDTLALLLNSSNIELLILNGKTVINTLQKLGNFELEEVHMPSWTLPRKSSEGVQGYAYKGKIKSIGKIRLKREIIVLGFNHNIQSSYGVTSQVQHSIRSWISESAKEIFDEKQ